MKELTIIFNAQITMIEHGEEDKVLPAAEIAAEIKRRLGADDVLVNDLKVFISKEDHKEEHEVDHIE